jgi:hypothetical protein
MDILQPIINRLNGIITGTGITGATLIGDRTIVAITGREKTTAIGNVTAGTSKTEG